MNNNNYPVRRKGQGSSLVPSFNQNSTNFRIPAPIIPRYSKDHNVAGLIKSRIHIKNARGDEMDIYQSQHVLNLLNGNQGSWYINEHGNTNRNYRRKR